jgi:asparagine N-glycosylation enzyme membrane subunit Stt3
MEGAGGGLGALGFWLFIAAIIVAGTWYDIRRKESQQETLRRLVESGRDLDPGMIEKLVNAGGSKSLERDLKVAGLITLSVAPGLLILGFVLSFVSEGVLVPLLGVSALVGFVGAGLYAAAKMVERRYPDHQG